MYRVVLYSWANATHTSKDDVLLQHESSCKPTSRQVPLSLNSSSLALLFPLQMVTVFFAAVQYCCICCTVSHCGNGPADKCFTSCGQTAKRCTSHSLSNVLQTVSHFYFFFLLFAASLKPLADS